MTLLPSSQPINQSISTTSLFDDAKNYTAFVTVHRVSIPVTSTIKRTTLEKRQGAKARESDQGRR